MVIQLLLLLSFTKIPFLIQSISALGSQREFSVTKAFFSLKRLSQFLAPTLKRQPSDNVASLWGKILLGSEIQEKNAENNLLENQSNIKGTKGIRAPSLHQHWNELVCILYI